MRHRTRVLVVDDEKDTVTTLLALLVMERYNAKGLYDARSILTDVRAFNPHIIILDIAIPGRSGWDAAREIRKRRTAKPPMLIAVSGEYTKGADKILGARCGFDHYLIKPCDPHDLLQLVASYSML